MLDMTLVLCQDKKAGQIMGIENAGIISRHVIANHQARA
jgi:hypothetical protein